MRLDNGRSGDVTTFRIVNKSFVFILLSLYILSFPRHSDQTNRQDKMVDYEAVVIGSGPGGLSTVAALLDTDINRILWVDRDFTGGRLNTMYREISS
jgi:heterodisulfide reductase subunit A-like polyferredoxin